MVRSDGHSLGWSDLQAWVGLTGEEFAGWELEALLTGSRAYAASYAKSDQKNTPCPWAGYVKQSQSPEAMLATLKGISGVRRNPNP